MSSEVELANVDKKVMGFSHKLIFFIFTFIVPFSIMLFITYEIWNYFINYIIYSNYLMGTQITNSMSLPLRISLMLSAILISFGVFMQYFLKKLFAIKHWSESEINFIGRIKTWSTRLNIAIFLMTILPLAYYLSVGLSLFRPYEYLPFSTAVVNDMALHESGHGLINSIVFPNTTSELRLFNSGDLTNVDHFLGREYVKYLPGGIHRSNKGSAYLKDEIFKKIEVSLGGLAAEEVLSPTGASVGASGDLENVEALVVLLVNNGLSSLGPIQWDLLSVDQRQKLYTEIVNPLYEKTKKLLLLNQDSVKRLSNELVKRKVIDGVSAKQILGPLKEE